MESRVTRVYGEGWFADVPTECGWVADSCMHIQDAEAKRAVEAEESLELEGCVLVRGDASTIITCGGLIVSVPSSTVPEKGEAVRVVFTRGEAGAVA